MSELINIEGPFRFKLWQALQLQHYLTSLPRLQSKQTPLTPLETICTQESAIRHQLLLMHDMIAQPSEDYKPGYVLQRERELNRSFTPKQLREMNDGTLRSLVNSKTQETNYKILSRWYRTPVVLHKFFPATFKLCWRFETEEGSPLHIFWACPILRPFWSKVRENAQRMTDHHVLEDPAFFLLNYTRLPPTAFRQSIVRHLLNVTKLCIPPLLNRCDPPSITQWICKVDEIRVMENLPDPNRDNQGSMG